MNTQERQVSELTVLDIVPFGEPGKGKHFFALRLTPPEWKSYSPGQFVMVRPKAWGQELTWGRPFSICLMTPRDLVVFFQVAGRGTERLANLRSGDQVEVWGPLGNGFIMEKGTPTLLLAGGIGIAPFLGYAHDHPTPGGLHLDFGHRMPLSCYPFDDFSDKITTANYPERKPEDLEAFIAVMDAHIADYAARGGLVLACGPTPFLKTVQSLAAKHKARAQLSLENRMACGVGACVGCVVRTNPANPPEGYKADPALPVTTCTCGPVFWSDSIRL